MVDTTGASSTRSSATVLRDLRRTVREARRRPTADTSYAVYLALLVVLVAVVPVVRAGWLFVTDPVNAVALTSAATMPVIAGVVGLVWAAAVIAGRLRGPVVFTPFLAHALTTSPVPQRRAFARQAWMSVVTLSVAGALCGATLAAASAAASAAAVTSAAASAVASPSAAALAAASSVSVATPEIALGVALAASVGAACGIVAALLWLVGQAVPPRWSALAIGVLAALSTAAFGAQAWGFSFDPTLADTTLAGLAAVGAHPLAAPGALLAALTLLAVVPLLLSRLEPRVVLGQSLRWEAVRLHTSTLELSASVATYQSVPRAGRRRFAIGGRARSLPAIIVRRDAVAALRTPGRLAIGVLVLLACGALIAGAAVVAPPAWMLGAIAGLAAYAAAGPLSDGLRHAVEAASALPLYGTSDSALLLLHTLFPALAVGLVVATGAVLVTAFWPPAAALPLASIGSAVIVAIGSVVLRLMNALKPPLPLALLTPIPTPAGDMAALHRVIWALDGVLLAGLLGAAASLSATAILAPLAVVAVAGLIARRRWVVR
ncbi:hypothetical protein ALI44B_07645 [Leifsonia sp. ALI-44-B]|uniref:hypothetical protein n=1 Tax=Leifsonia sp. ALI-44-B TaxID=1933776 RepID=UPI00097C631B|nr:hypothetical protein [Leifsonia sp. ALI-44-B]ONI60488.1 hypothetical protein ALI44B_07645 [Leifsonia sp. ALI-44-B]